MLSTKEANVGSLLLALLVILGIVAAVHLIGRPQLFDNPAVPAPTVLATPERATSAPSGTTPPTVIYECIRDGVRTFSDRDCGPDSTSRVIDEGVTAETAAPRNARRQGSAAPNP